MLLPLVAEALILQDDADRVLVQLRARVPVGQTAPVAGRLAQAVTRASDPHAPSADRRSVGHIRGRRMTSVATQASPDAVVLLADGTEELAGV